MTRCRMRLCIPVGFAIMSALVVTACAPKIEGWARESYRIKHFDEQMLARGRIALFPVMILQKGQLAVKQWESLVPPAPYTPESRQKASEPEPQSPTPEEYRIGISQILLQKMQARNSALKILPPADVLKGLNDAGLAKSYMEFDRDYLRLGLDEAQLRAFSHALGCRYLFMTQAGVEKTESSTSVTVVWSFGSRASIRSVEVFAQIWDADTGREVWQAGGSGYARVTGYGSPPLVRTLADVAVDHLLGTLLSAGRL